MDDKETLFRRVDTLLDRIEQLMTATTPEPSWDALAYRWQSRGHQGVLKPVRHIHHVPLNDLLCMERQKRDLVRNTHQFVTGQPANNALLWGARGTGKSTLIKAVFNTFMENGLRLIEVEKSDLVHMPEIIDGIYGRPERFVIYCDDLSFEADDPGYKSLKAVLDGSIVATPDNLLIYATSNRRHLLPEYQSENLESRLVDGEIHHGESVEEKISLSDRFGLWLSFHPFNQKQYLEIVRHWLARMDVTPSTETDEEALQWALRRGNRSGRTAWQFARDRAGRMQTTSFDAV